MSRALGLRACSLGPKTLNALVISPVLSVTVSVNFLVGVGDIQCKELVRRLGSCLVI
jgi:hypothetical protein